MTTDGIVDYTGGGTLAANLENGGGRPGAELFLGFDRLWRFYVYRHLLRSMDFHTAVHEGQPDGFGDPYNHGCRAFGITEEGLHVGTANPFYGTQVWKLSEVSAPGEETDASQKAQDSEENAGSGNDADTGNQEPEKPGEEAAPSPAAGVVCAVVILTAAGIAFAVYKKKKKQG